MFERLSFQERLPQNLGDFTVPLGIAEVVRTGTDATIVSYGSTFNLAARAAERLAEKGVQVELVDLQTLLPLDRTSVVGASLAKTIDCWWSMRTFPGERAPTFWRTFLNRQGGWKHLDAAPKTLTAQAHLPPYGSDGDYYSKPSVDDIYEAIYAMMNESNPDRFPL